MTTAIAADLFPACLGFTWRTDEDGQPYHVTPGDSGGPTAYGVTLETYAGYRKAHGFPHTTASDLKAATQAGLSEIIRAYFWMPVAGPQLPQGLDLLVYDFGFGSGPVTSARVLQQALGVEADGWIGPETQAAVAGRARNTYDLATFASDLAARHDAFYRSLHDYALFGRGWSRRNADRLTLALDTIKANDPVGYAAAAASRPHPSAPAPALQAGMGTRPVAVASAAQSTADLNAASLAGTLTESEGA